MLQDKQNVCYS